MPSEAPPHPGPRPGRRAWPWLVACGLGLLPALWAVNRWVTAPAHLGLTAGRLAACPESPNCVSSQAAPDDPHRVAPLPFHDAEDAAAALARVRQVLDDLPGAQRVRQDAGYLHYVFRTPLCRFVDDLEVAIDGDARVIHVRSASRLGYSDLGTNRRRVEALRRRLEP